ncbi:hypothetical protein Val02_69180 [Virgisporangium aliadipatigenens]|uniref:Major tail protein n=1 Tax=Virgisporangium aliadipatigenens TaxID=741659 RepID=A0A8J3YT74_9ACTN|nr:hypothetical protein [Virgisporangium aliadipatigenens]GIJ50032.1 hypothetical protein Val02_69180 [Virgisporangium aliadipatigenens]
MALDDSTLVIPGVGFIYTAAPGTAKPANVVAPETPWVDQGHTSEDGLTISFEISRTKRRTWRARAGVRVSVDEVNFTLGWQALQVDNDSLAAYFGGGDISTADVFGVLKAPAPIERALFIRLVDGPTEVDLYAAKVAIGPNGESTAGPEDFAGFPLQAEVLDHAAAAHLAQWLAPHLGAPSGA